MTAPNEPFHRSHVSSKQSELKRHYIVQRGNWESFQFKNFVFTWNKHRQKDDHVSQAHKVVRMSCGNVSISCKFSTLNLIVTLFSPSVPSEVILSLCQSQLNSNLMLIHVIIWLRQLIHHIGYSGLNFFELLSKSQSSQMKLFILSQREEEFETCSEYCMPAVVKLKKKKKNGWKKWVSSVCWWLCQQQMIWYSLIAWK